MPAQAPPGSVCEPTPWRAIALDALPTSWLAQLDHCDDFAHCLHQSPAEGLFHALGVAGAPMNNDNRFCPSAFGSCYLYNATTRNYTAATTYCQGLGGQLVSYNKEDEQLQVRRPGALDCLGHVRAAAGVSNAAKLEPVVDGLTSCRRPAWGRCRRSSNTSKRRLP